jgi:signal transduction histidine kinase
VPDVAAALTAPAAGVDVATGIVLAAVGALALRRGRGPLLLVAGVAWLAGDVWSGLLYAHRGPLAQLLLGRSPLTALAYVDGLVPPLARSPWPTLVLAGAVVVVVAWGRRVGPIIAAVAVAGALAYEAVGKLTGTDTAALAAWSYDVAVVAVGLASVLVTRSRPAGAVAADLVIDLASEPQAMRTALARAVGDPTLEVAYRVGDAWVDEAGRPVAAPSAAASRAVRFIDDVAVLVHDPAALNDEALIRCVESAVRLTLANIHLQADVAARVREVELSRRRLVEAGAAERRRLRDQLRAGAERHLAAAGAVLEELPGAAELRAELEVARGDLGRLAQGIHPRALTEHGLRAALGELAAQSAAPVQLEVTDRRFPGPQETVAYFVCSEALANVAKYAFGAKVRVSVSADAHRLRVRIGDDGPGGADPARGSGLHGLADRVEALGGRLSVHSPRGGGTRLEAQLPVAT